MYKPLPAGLTIKQSGIHGLGLFATEHIPANSILGIAHIDNTSFPHGYIRTGLGAFYNHSEHPTCETVKGYWQHMAVVYLKTSKDISPGDELTAKYTLYENFKD
jgi:SET domain-containing protein|tara:strand:+ start:6277 stop:6588 length:312 start_codon:yes stop_codon:yes gene_type:complete